MEIKMFTPKNNNYDTRPVLESLVAQNHYVGIWICENAEDGVFYQVDYNVTGVFHPDDANKSAPPRRVIPESGSFEDGLIRGANRKDTVFVKTYDEAINLVIKDIAGHNLEKDIVV